MPVQFRCCRCATLLSTARRKLGQEVDCPACREKTLVADDSFAPGVFGIAWRIPAQLWSMSRCGAISSKRLAGALGHSPSARVIAAASLLFVAALLPSLLGLNNDAAASSVVITSNPVIHPGRANSMGAFWDDLLTAPAPDQPESKPIRGPKKPATPAPAPASAVKEPATEQKILPALPSPPAPVVQRKEYQTYGTRVRFASTPVDASQRAMLEDKLLFVLHLSGNFEDTAFT